jgi:hypothetical protein
MYRLHEETTGDFMLVCRWCSLPHYRRIEHGAATHCDIGRQTGKPVELRA